MPIAKAIRENVTHHAKDWLFVGVGLFYLVGVWEHLPFSGGHIYSDIVSVYQSRFCYSGPCGMGLPYVNYFVEYPVITGFFMYAMGLLGHMLPLPGRDFLGSYYTYTSVFLLIPTVLLVDNLVKLMEQLGIAQKSKRAFLFFVATPSFVFMLLLNWYIIGVFFAIFGLRVFLEGNHGGRSKSMLSGALFGLSAAANMITAVPALGILIFGTESLKERIKFALGITTAVLAVYIPVIIINSFPHSYVNASHAIVNYPFQFPNVNVVTDFLRYEQNWYAEGSWMLGFFTNTNPIRHYIFFGLFTVMAVVISLMGLKTEKEVRTELDRANLIVVTGSLYMFAFLFCTYVCTPQMNLALLPFFVLLPSMTKHYSEFLVFEIVNSLVIVWGFSAPLAFLGIQIPTPAQFGPIWESPIQFLAVLRSFWIGKFLLVDGLWGWPLTTERTSAVLKPIEIAQRKMARLSRLHAIEREE
jgi:hypothetical protein